jgi:hypothetical protein
MLYVGRKEAAAMQLAAAVLVCGGVSCRVKFLEFVLCRRSRDIESRGVESAPAPTRKRQARPDAATAPRVLPLLWICGIRVKYSLLQTKLDILGPPSAFASSQFPQCKTIGGR